MSPLLASHFGNDGRYWPHWQSSLYLMECSLCPINTPTYVMALDGRQIGDWRRTAWLCYRCYVRSHAEYCTGCTLWAEESAHVRAYDERRVG